MHTEELLKVEGLSIAFGSAVTPVLNGVSFAIRRGETLGIVGESGSGKSITSLALMGLLPGAAKITGGSASFNSQGDKINLLEAGIHGRQQLRGRRMAMIFQEPMTSLNPVMKCGEQVSEVLRHHLKMGRSQAKARTIELFTEVELPRPGDMYDQYPHELSGGQKQRVMIALAMSCKPDLLIADEPTTALDVTVQKRILLLMNKLKAENQMGLIFITHDLGVVHDVADRIAVMHKGEIVEFGTAQEVLRNPQHPYTKALVACRPRLDAKPEVLPTVASMMGEVTRAVRPAVPPPYVLEDEEEKIPLIELRDVNVLYATKKMWNKSPSRIIHAVNNVSLEVYRGETLGLVGESGCGKSSLGRAILRLQPLYSGYMYFKGRDITSYDDERMRPLRKSIQIVFQDPYSSLNQRLTIGEALLEPLQVHRLAANASEGRSRAISILDRVGLPANAMNKYPHEFSGGQRQRICIARALMVEPEFILCDESVSALDVSVQAQVLNLLNELKRELGLTYVFISHDLSVVKYMSDRMIVMRNGMIEEEGDVEQVYQNPQSEYTRELIQSIPVLN